MSTDAISALVNLASNVHSSFTALFFAIGGLLAVTGVIQAVSKEATLARQVPGHNGTGKVVGVLLFCGMLAALQQVIGAGSRQFGWSGATFDEVSYVSESTFGVAAQAANAALTLIQTLGVVFCLMGVLRMKRAMKDGHTGLSAGEDVSSGIVRFITGVFAVCAPTLLDALQNSLGIAF